MEGRTIDRARKRYHVRLPERLEPPRELRPGGAASSDLHGPPDDQVFIDVEFDEDRLKLKGRAVHDE